MKTSLTNCIIGYDQQRLKALPNPARGSAPGNKLSVIPIRLKA